MIESFGKIKRSALIETQVPSFISEENPVFVAFIEAYYEFLSQKSWVPSEKFVDYIDADTAPQEFIDKFWEELQSIPVNIAADKRLLAKHIRDLYKSKGSVKSIELLFRILYNENIELYEPKEDMLKPSDGKWVQVDIIRTKVPVGFDLSTLSGKKLHQYSPNGNELCNFVVASVTVVSASENFLYIEITPTSFNGTVYNDFPLKNSAKTISLEIVPSFGIDSYFNRGSLYSAGEIFYSGSNPVYIQSIGSGPVEGIFIISPGSGYAPGDYLTVEEAGTGGLGLSIVVEQTDALGGVLSLRMVSGGLGYESMPTIVGNGTGSFVPWSTTSGRILSLSVKDAVSDNTPINFVTRMIVDRGTGAFLPGETLQYVANSLTLETGFAWFSEDDNVIVNEDQPLTPLTIGTVASIDSALSSIFIKDSYGSGKILLQDNSELLLEDGQAFSNEFITLDLGNYQIRGETSGAVTDVLFVNPVVLSTKLDPIFRQSAKFRNEDGFVGTPTKKIQDSYYYQDFSYVIKSSYSFENYKNILYKLIHPAGTQAFGQVEINSFVRSTLDHIKYAFREAVIKIQSNVVLRALVDSSIPSVEIEAESAAVSGPSWGWIEKYKGILSNQYETGTYGSSDIGGTAQAYWTALDALTTDQLAFGNTPASFLSSYSLEDLMRYSEDFTSVRPLILDGSFKLDGSEDLDGVENKVDSTVQIGKFQLKKNRRIVWQLDSEIKKVPLNPVDDLILTTDSLFYTLYSDQRELTAIADASSGVTTFNRTIDEPIALVESGPGVMKTTLTNVNDLVATVDQPAIQFSTFGPVSTAGVTESITSVGLDSPKETPSVTETLTFFVSSAASINSTAINSSSL